MKKSIIIGISILTIFILCSISFQPLTANDPIVTINQAKDSRESNNRMDSYRNIYNRIVEIKSQFDCGCLLVKNNNPFICSTLISILFVLYSLFFAFNILYNIQALQQIIHYLVPPLESITNIIHDWAIYYDCVEGFP